MQKILIDTNEKFIDFLIACGINRQVLDHASKMDLNVPKIIYDKILMNFSEKTLDEVTKNLLGVYGNYIATKYLQIKYKNIKNEVPIKDENENIITKADIAFVDKDNMINYCEVKAVNKILDNDESYEENNVEIIKYKSIGKKLMSQVSKLLSTGSKVNVIVFRGCDIDNKVREKLTNSKVRIITILIDINNLENEIKKMIVDIYQYVKFNVTINLNSQNKIIKSC